MRAIRPGHIAFFLLLVTLIAALALFSTWGLSLAWPAGGGLGDFRGVFLVAAAMALVYLYALVVYRVFLLCRPLTEGPIDEGSAEEFGANVNSLFYLLLFNPLICGHLIPVPLVRLLYLGLGARLGSNTYSAGVMLDPPLTSVGSNTVIGHDAVIFAHVIEGRRLELKAVRIGDNVTIGATAVVMAGVRIGDGAIVSAGAVVIKDTVIGKREVWGGVPARRLRAAAEREDGSAPA